MTDSNHAFPDIEIYIKRPELEQLEAWLKATVGPIKIETRGSSSQVTLGNGESCLIVANAVKGGYTSVWFKTRHPGQLIGTVRWLPGRPWAWKLAAVMVAGMVTMNKAGGALPKPAKL